MSFKKDREATANIKSPLSINEEHNCFKRRNEWEDRYVSKSIPDF